MPSVENESRPRGLSQENKPRHQETARTAVPHGKSTGVVPPHTRGRRHTTSDATQTRERHGTTVHDTCTWYVCVHGLCRASVACARCAPACYAWHSLRYVSFFYFISFHFISFHFISFHFISFHVISWHLSHFISCHFISFDFICLFTRAVACYT